jgi:hypothetical protein
VLRRHIDPMLRSLTFGRVVQHLQDVIGTLGEPPLVIGRSVGGLIVQRLVNDGLTRVGVVIVEELADTIKGLPSEVGAGEDRCGLDRPERCQEWRHEHADRNPRHWSDGLSPGETPR